MSDSSQILRGNAVIGQSGGPTAVINQSLVGDWARPFILGTAFPGFESATFPVAPPPRNYLAELHAALAAQDGIAIGEGPEDYATPLQSEGNDLTHVGRLRHDPTVADGRGVVFWCVSDNLRKGAATNAIQIAEELIARNLLKRSS